VTRAEAREQRERQEHRERSRRHRARRFVAPTAYFSGVDVGSASASAPEYSGTLSRAPLATERRRPPRSRAHDRGRAERSSREEDPRQVQVRRRPARRRPSPRSLAGARRLVARRIIHLLD
jgi:hypothetical protein